MSRFLVTGGAGFIGSNFVRHLLATDPDAVVTNLDALTYAGVKSTVDELDRLDRHTFVLGDIRDADLVEAVIEDHDVVVNFAAESHVDRSIEGPLTFVETNVVGTGVLLDAARRHGVGRFIQVSTDEVYGSLAAGRASENAPLAPSSPYSATKAAGDLLAQSYRVTYGYPVIITRATNNFGPYQCPEKVIPLFVTSLSEGKTVPVYGDGRNERDWLYVEDHCSALAAVANWGEPGTTYNIGADCHLTNLELTRRILGALGFGEDRIEFVADRPGHDLRYAVDTSRIRSLGWAPSEGFDERLEQTIAWYRDRRDWWLPLRDGA